MKKLSKRLLSVLLAAFLVMTSIPMFAIDAFAADYSSLDSAMAAYETKMDGNFYTNMETAYRAYMAADVVKKNENATQSEINSAASALTTATDNMENFSGHAANGPVHYGTTDEEPNVERYRGILWADGSADTAYDTNQGGKAQTSTVGITYGAYFYFYYPTNSVLMYDGRTTPVLPIMMGVIDRDSNYNLHPCYVRTDSADFALDDYWYGYDDNFVWPATKDWLIGYSVATDVGMDDAVEIDNTSTIRSFSNYMRCKVNPGSTTMVTVNGIEWREQHNMSVVGVTTHTDEDKVLNMTIPVRVINYKKLLDKLGQVGGLYHRMLDDVSDYKEDGGLLELIQAIDYAATDPNSFFTSSNQYQACANWIDAAITRLNAVQTPQMDASVLASVEGAQNALDSFETKMAEGYWKNVLPVYQKYVYLKAVVDAEEYGDRTYSTEDIAAATQELNDAVAAMVQWTPYVPNGTVKTQDDSTAVSNSAYVSGIIGNYTASTSTMGYDSLGGSGTSPGGVYAFVNSPTTILALYDGSTPIRIPVMTAWHNNMGFTIGTGNRRMMNAVYPIVYNDGNYTPADNADFGLTQAWGGHTNDNWNSNMSSTPNNVVFNWTSSHDSPAYSGTLAGYSQATYNAANSYSENYTWQGQRSSKIYAYWNFMQYKGGATGFSNGIKTAKVNFWGMSKWPKEAIDTEGRHWFGSTSSPVTTVTIIDYKTPVDTFKANWDTQVAAFAAGDYDEGGFASVFAAMDDFTSYNGLESATVSNAATVASNLNTKAAAVGSATGTTNSQYYQDLRDKLLWYPSAEKYVAGMADPTLWTAESWQDLLDAIADARAIFTALPTNNPYYYITASDAHAAEQAIQTAYDNLVEAGVLIDPAVEAYAEMISLLDDYTYLASDLRTAANLVSSLTTACYDAGPIGTKIPATPANIAAIANEVATFNAAADALEEQTFDKDAYDSYIEAAHRGVNDPDAFDIAQLQQDIQTLENAAFETIHFPHYADIVGLKANAQTAVDTAWSAIQTDLSSPMQYTVTVVDADGNAITGVGEGTYAYGTEITIDAGTADYKYDYVSNTSNTGTPSHKVKDVGTLDSFTFTVQGNTTITVGAPTANKPVTVTYKANLDGNQFTIKTDYVAAGTVITNADVKAPSYAFYSYQGFTQATDDAGDITVTLNYNAVAGGTPLYQIWNDYDEVTEEHYFNELVTLDFEDAPAVLIAKSQDDYDAWYEQCDEGVFTDRMVSIGTYGSTYTFRAKEDLWTVYIDDIETYADSYQTMKDETGADSAVYTNTVANVNSDANALVTYNGVALPEDYEIVEAGVLVQYNKQGGDLLDKELNFNTVGQDVGNDKVRRLKATKIHTEEDNRFSITLNLADGAKAKYRVYVNYKDGQGNAHTVMSDVTETITIG